MFLFRLIRKIFSLFRSDLTAHEIALGLCLGILAGCIPFSSAWALTTVVLGMVVFRASFTSFFLCAGLVKFLGFAVAPVCYKLGTFLLDGSFPGFFETLANTPGIALLDVHRYVVSGGFLLALIASVPAYPLVRFLVNRYRKYLVGWAEKSPKWEAFTGNRVVKTFTWLFFGKKGDYKETLETRKSPIRKGAILGILCFAATVALFTFFFGDAVAKAGFESGLSAAFAADVSIEDLGLSFAGGSLEFDNLFVRERKRKGEISYATLLRGNLDASELWRRRLVFEEIVLERVSVTAARDSEGNFNFGRGKKKRKKEKEPDRKEVFSHLGDILENRELGQDIVNRLLDVIFPDKTSETVIARRKELEEIRRYTDIYAEHLLERDAPFVVINDLWIRGLDLMLLDEGADTKKDSFTGLTLHATNLSSNPKLLGNDSVIELFSGPPEAAGAGGRELRRFDLELTLRWSLPDPVHDLTVRFRDLPAGEVCGHMNEGDRIRISEGVIAMETTASLGSESFSCKNAFCLSGLVFAPAERGKKILGLDGNQFCQGLNLYLETNSLPIDVDLDGPYTAPRLRIDEKELIAVVRKGLAGAVRKVAEEKIDKEREKLEEEAKKKLKEEQDKLNEKVNKRIDKLFGGRKKKKK